MLGLYDLPEGQLLLCLAQVSYPGSTSTPELSQLNQDFHPSLQGMVCCASGKALIPASPK